MFPDDEALVQAEFERNLPFAESVANSAARPGRPEVGRSGITTKPFYLESDDPYKARHAGRATSAFKYSYGDPQPVQVLAKRSLGAVTVKYRINGGAVAVAPDVGVDGRRAVQPGVRLLPPVMRGTVTGTEPGDSVEVWFEGGGQKSESFTYQAVSETGNRDARRGGRGLHGRLARADPGPALRRARTSTRWPPTASPADVYDVDARGRIAPDALGVLSHYDAVIWYTGDDVVTRTAGPGAGNADRLALDEMLEFRAYMDEGGRVLYTGKHGRPAVHRRRVGNQFYDPKGEVACSPSTRRIDPRRCLLLRGSTRAATRSTTCCSTGSAAWSQIAGDGQDGNGAVFDVNGIGDPFDGPRVGLDGPAARATQDRRRRSWRRAASCRSTSTRSSRAGLGAVGQARRAVRPAHRQQVRLLADRRRVVQAAHARDRGAGRRRRPDVLDVVRHRAGLGLPVVEARTPGGDDWTTLPDANGHTSQNTGESCPGAAGWGRAAPAARRTTRRKTATRRARPPAPTRRLERRHRATRTAGSSGAIDLDEYAGKTVEISIAYISDWGTQNLGVFLDDFAWPGGSTSFEGTDTGGWQITGPPAGSGANANNFEVTDAGGFPVGAAITTPKSLLFGYGFEAISTAAQRNVGDGPGRVLPVAVDARVQPAAASAAAGPPALSFGAAQRNLFP